MKIDKKYKKYVPKIVSPYIKKFDIKKPVHLLLAGILAIVSVFVLKILVTLLFYVGICVFIIALFVWFKNKSKKNENK